MGRKLVVINPDASPKEMLAAVQRAVKELDAERSDTDLPSDSESAKMGDEGAGDDRPAEKA